MSILTLLSDLFNRNTTQAPTVASTVPPDIAQDATWKQRVLQACATGDFKALNILMNDRDEKADPESDQLISSMMSSAVRRNQTEMLRYLIEQYPQFPTGSQAFLGVVQRDAFMEKGLLPVYMILVERWPIVQTLNCGELGDHLGLAAIHLDVPFVEYLLRHGADATQARYAGGIPVGCNIHPPLTCTLKLIAHHQVLYFLCQSNARKQRQDAKDRATIIGLLREHGATEEGKVEY